MTASSIIAKGDSYYRKLEQFDDRCDRCGESAQAFARAVKVKEDGTLLELLLCGHHFNKHSYKLGLEGWLLQNNLGEINIKPNDFED